LAEHEDEAYPVRTLHEFLSELETEWRKFWFTSILTLIASVLLLSLVILFALQIIGPDHRFAVRVLATSIGGVGLAYSVYAIVSQNRFFKRWGRRFGRLRKLEEKILPAEG